jgi:hypothetical protein
VSYPHHTAIAVRADGAAIGPEGATRLEVAGDLMHQITSQPADLTAWADGRQPRWTDAHGECAIGTPWLRDEDVAALPMMLAQAAPDAVTVESSATSGRAFDADDVLLAAYEVGADPAAALAALGLSRPEPEDLPL